MNDPASPSPPTVELELASNPRSIKVSGGWTFDSLDAMHRALEALQPPGRDPLVFRCDGVTRIDLTGAWTLLEKARAFEAAGIGTDFAGFKADHFKFLEQVRRQHPRERAPASAGDSGGAIAAIAAPAETIGRHLVGLLDDVGQIAVYTLQAILRPNRLSLRETAWQIRSAGVDAIFIVTLIAFLMGVVLAYQGARQLGALGAEVFTIDLVGIAMWREMGPLLTAIIVAGRSGSAFAATLGAMKLNEEIDALRVSGLSPTAALVAPRLLGLLIALPILTLIANVAGMAGAWLLAVTSLDLSTGLFLERLSGAVRPADFWTGMVKVPVFALIIAGTGTLRGLAVTQSAEELGRLTTQAVVQGITLVIGADAVFSVAFAELGW